uniref:Uncharacterized protein n=1 Tax=Setaria digitata TaxID=48799 RepID=A0A915PQ61_9BILA
MIKSFKQNILRHVHDAANVKYRKRRIVLKALTMQHCVTNAKDYNGSKTSIHDTRQINREEKQQPPELQFRKMQQMQRRGPEEYKTDQHRMIVSAQQPLLESVSADNKQRIQPSGNICVGTKQKPITHRTHVSMQLTAIKSSWLDKKMRSSNRKPADYEVTWIHVQ